MSWAVLLLSLTSLCTLKPGETGRISCTGMPLLVVTMCTGTQKAGNRPRYLLWFKSDSSKHQGDGVPDRFSGSKDSPNNVGYLTIKGALLEDDADYYCAIWYSSSLHSGVLL
ncbi:hypothetical protein XELAEV_18007649mg [Xenopus laevis]|uniref:Immunoglobulin V-set domain-containing protein n=1 Tax=Xenopus laevis TaxID=8355 RepID=A0A974I4X9_XENLA|nr:hypothetical protein XELAEV_18007649mg [Xenopus laevis]